MNQAAFEYRVDAPKSGEDLLFAEVAGLTAARIPSRLKMLASDVLALAVSMLAAYALHTLLASDVVTTGKYGVILNVLDDRIIARYPLMLALLLGLFAYGGLYGRRGWESGELRRIVQATALVGVCDAALVAAGQATVASPWNLLIWPIAAVLVVVFRMLLRVVPFGIAANAEPVILVGGGVTTNEFVAGLRESRAAPLQVVQRLPLLWLAELGASEIEYRVRGIAERCGVPVGRLRIVVAPSNGEIRAAKRLVKELGSQNCPFSLLLPFAGLAGDSLSLHAALGADFVLADVDHRWGAGLGRAAKRIVDLTIASLGIVLFSPLMAMIALRLNVEGRPIIFSQLRVGQSGRRFKCLKFRTMLPDAEERLAAHLAAHPEAQIEWAHHQKLAKDPRVTEFGAFLRKTSLDELPQLFNVLSGDMSVVGPRPIVAPEVSGYDSDRAYYESPEFANYDRCKPGITGLWQVSGRAHTAHSERVRLDGWYARNWSIWLDLMIVLKTVRAILTRSGT